MRRFENVSAVAPETGNLDRCCQHKTATLRDPFEDRRGWNGRDGKQIAFSRGTQMTNVILIRDFRQVQ
jgi:hypothetical protein